MKDKRILLCCNRTLGIGGIEKALTTFVKTLDTINNKVTLVLNNSRGELFQQLPTENIQILYTGNINSAEILKDDIKHFRITEIAKGVYNRVMLRLNQNWYARIMYTYRIIQRKLQFQEPFDCAISFTTDYSDLSMVLTANTDKRVAFVHADATQNPYIATLNDGLLQQFDKIYCVSESSKELFLKVHPDCANVMDIFHNIVDIDEILHQGELPVEDMVLDGTPTLCTVGRLSPEKGQSLIPETASLLRKEGYIFRWYIVGDGSLRPQLEQTIKQLGLNEQVILLGAKANPYPYMKNCDVYVQTSFTEAYCITVKEARVFKKIIVTTDFSSVQEQIIDGLNGLIAKKTSESLAEKISAVLNSPERYWVKLAPPKKKNQVEMTWRDYINILREKKMAKLSVIVPVYNVERYLRQCLDSILVQTFSDIELIVVDDGSTDQSGRICDEYAEKDSRVVVIHKENGGLADARNAGLDVISSEYVGFVDSDDWIRPQMYEMLLSCHEKTNAEIVACRIHFFSDDGKINEVWPQTEQDCIYSRSDFINHFFPDIKRSIMPSVCNKIFKKSVFEAIRFPVGRRYEDAYIQLDIYDSTKKIAVINEPLYEYRKRSGSITDQVSYEYYLDQLAFSVRHLSFFEAGELKQQCEYALAQVVKHYLIAYFAQKYGQSEWKAELQPYSKLISKYFTQIIKNPQICRLHKLVFMISRIFPSCAVGICQTYFPECLPEFLRKQPERVN